MDFDPSAAPALVVVAMFFVSLALLLFARVLLFRNLRSLAARTETLLDDRIVHALETPTIFWCVAIALQIAIGSSDLPARVQALAATALTVVLIFSITLAVANIAGGVTTHLLERQGDRAGRVPGLGQTVIRTGVMALGTVYLLNALGVEIAPLLTALGVGGLALALALQETLSNFFAGIHLLLERPFQIGQYIRLEDGREGHVRDIGWRTTRVHTLDDDDIVVPNSKMAGSTVVNFHMPFPRSRVSMDVGVAYDTDPDHFTRVVLEEVAALRAELGHILDDPAPDVLLVKFGEYALEFRVRIYLDDVSVQAPVLNRVHRAVFRRLREEGIHIPYPTRVVHGPVKAG